MDRRSFLGALGALGAAQLGCARGGTADRAVDTAGAAAQRRSLDKVGLQLYTIRDALQRDFEGSLANVARIGYREVEFAGNYGPGPSVARQVLDRLGLEAPAGHVPIEALRDNWEQTLASAVAVGHRYIVVPWIPVEMRTESGYGAVADLLNRTGTAARAAGVGIAYHNHDFEFAPLNGRLPYDLLLERTDPGLVRMEMDLFWINKGGRDPLEYFARYPGRFPMVHVKDADATGAMVDVGSGRIDFARIFARREQAGIRHFFVEHDQPAAPFDSIRASYEHLKRLQF